MKKRILGIAFGIALLLTGTFAISDVRAQEVISDGGNGNLEFVSTNCVVLSTGKVLGKSNNCKPGSSFCSDNDCSRF